jgi:hypothetical protein
MGITVYPVWLLILSTKAKAQANDEIGVAWRDGHSSVYSFTC